MSKLNRFESHELVSNIKKIAKRHKKIYLNYINKLYIYIYLYYVYIHKIILYLYISFQRVV